MKERIARILSEHWAVLITDGPHPQELRCAGHGCTWTGTWYTEHAAHLADLIDAAYAPTTHHEYPEHEHEWIEVTSVQQLPDRHYVCAGCPDIRIDHTETLNFNS